MVAQQLVDAVVEVVEDGSVAGEDDIGGETVKAAQELEVAGEWVGLRLRPEPYVGCDAEQHMVAGEERAPRLVVEYELVVGVAGGVDDASRSASEREFILRPQRQHLLG